MGAPGDTVLDSPGLQQACSALVGCAIGSTMLYKGAQGNAVRLPRTVHVKLFVVHTKLLPICTVFSHSGVSTYSLAQPNRSHYKSSYRPAQSVQPIQARSILAYSTPSLSLFSRKAGLGQTLAYRIRFCWTLLHCFQV